MATSAVEILASSVIPTMAPPDSERPPATTYTVIRPTQHRNNQISFLRRPSVELVELVHVPGTGLQFASRQHHTSERYRYGDQFETYQPLAWISDYARAGAIRLASSVAPCGNLDQLAGQVRSFIHRYFDCSGVFESVAVLYVLHTWMYECFQAVPYLRFLGMSGIGKTRAMETVGALCYRSFTVAGAVTTAPMFRLIEALGGTMLIDEADFSDSQIGADVAKILNCGYQKGLFVHRMEQNSDGEQVPRLFEVFGPKIINGRRPFQDDATESRCLSYTPSPTNRNDVPRQLPPTFEAEAQQIRNQALGWRFDNLDSFEVRDVRVEGLANRTNQIILPLLLVAEQMSRPARDRYRNDLLEFARSRDQQMREESHNSVEAWLVEAYLALRERQAPTCKELVEEVKRVQGDPSLDRWFKPRKASSILTGMGFQTRHTNRGSEVTIDDGRLTALCQRCGIVM